MKKIILTLSGFLFLFTLSAQTQETLFGHIDDNEIGAFGSPLIEIGAVNGDVGGDVGGGGALILRGFFIGGYGLGADYPGLSFNNEHYDIRFKHGGLWFGYAPLQFKVIHPYSSLRIGWGKSQLRQGKEVHYSDQNFVLTPEIGIELNAFQFMKVAFTGGYRLVNGVNALPGLGNKDFSSPIGTITFRFGGFGGYDDWDF